MENIFKENCEGFCKEFLDERRKYIEFAKSYNNEECLNIISKVGFMNKDRITSRRA